MTLLRDGGVEVVVADNIADVERAARPDTLILVAQSQYLTDDALLDRLAKVPGDLLLVEPTARTREALMPGMRISPASTFDSDPNCALREATRAGSVRFGPSDTYQAVDGRTMTSCYDGVLIRYRDGGRTITAVGSTDFMTNDGLLQAGNAALAMNLAGDRPRVIWYAPHRIEGETSSPASVSDLIPDNVIWVVWQLWLVVLLIALWKGRRPGPLVAEQLPVVVRASETVEGRGRLYRSRRARDRAAEALRTATLQRLLPRLGLGAQAPAQAVVATVARRSGGRCGIRFLPPVRPTPGHRQRPTTTCPCARRNRKAGRTLVTQPSPVHPNAESARDALLALRVELAKAVVGQEGVVSGLVIALLCRGHVLLEGVPGVAKTLLVRALSAALQLEFKRVQFTPDLMPGDVTGSLVYDTRSAAFTFRPGPVFTNLLLADEINRTPPKTQAALLEAMEERQVTVDGEARPLPDPFIVAATQNPIEYEGTYQLPEAQLDRFLLKLNVTLPARDSEIAILGRHAHGFDPRDLVR